MHRSTLAATAVVALMAAAPAAQAATKDVSMGPPPAGQKALEKYGADVSAFFPNTVTVHVGDTVRFSAFGFHNLDIPARGQQGLALLTPNGSKATDVKDEAGQPFWFNGQDVLGFNAQLLPSSFGKTFAAPSTKRINSGLPLADKVKPVSVKFLKTGSYTFRCDVHPGMKGTVKVVGKSKPIPSKKADAAAVKRQIAAAATTARQLAATKPADGSISLGAAGPGGVEIFAFFPSTLRVPVGTTLRLQMSKGSEEVHTATVGPGDPENAPTSYLGTLAASFLAPAIDPRAVYSSDPPSGTATAITPTVHGNGFYNSGVLDQFPQTPSPASSSVTFAEAGTYTFYCLIHPFMKATVTVG